MKEVVAEYLPPPDVSRPETVVKESATGPHEYCRVSRKYRTVARIDREDWREHMAKKHTPWDPEGGGMRWVEGLGDNHAADYYRRCYSKDKINCNTDAEFFKYPASHKESDVRVTTKEPTADPRKQALQEWYGIAGHIDEIIYEAQNYGENYYEFADHLDIPGIFLVLTYEEAKQLTQERIKEHGPEWVFTELKAPGLSDYIDWESWARSKIVELEANEGGFSSELSAYADEEYEIKTEDGTFYIYQVQ